MSDEMLDQFWYEHDDLYSRKQYLSKHTFGNLECPKINSHK